MSRDPNLPRRPSWQNRGKQPASSKDPPKAPFVRGPKPAGDGAGWFRTKRGKLIFALGATFAVVAVFVIVAYLPDPDHRPHLYLIGTGYETNLAVPHNAAGLRGLDQIKEWAKKDGATEVHLKSENPVELDAKAIDQLFETSYWRSFRASKRDKVFLYVSAQGVVRDGVPYLVPETYHPGDPKESLLPFSSLLSAMEKGLPSEMKKILLLDVAGTRTNPSSGIDGPAFTEAILSEPFIEKLKVRNLVVVASAGKNQFSWVAPEWGTTVFSHYVLEGLKGGALKKGSAGEGHLSIQELADYVQDHVKDWVARNRNRSQVPTLLASPDAVATSLIYAKSYTPPTLPSRASRDEEFDKWRPLCEKMWTRGLELAGSSPPPWTSAPHLWRQHLDTMIRAEELFQDGDDKNAGKLVDLAGKQADTLRHLASADLRSKGLSLAMPSAAGLALSREANPEAMKVLDLFEKGLERGDFKASKDAVEKLEAKVRGSETERLLLRTQAAGRLLGRVAAAENFAQAWAEAQPALDALDHPSPPWRSAEAHFAVMLRNSSSRLEPLLKAKDQRGWQRLRRALQVRLLAEQAAVGLTGVRGDEALPALCEQTHAWIKFKITSADQRRRLGEDLLFSSNPDSWAESDKCLDEAAQKYAECQKEARAVRLALGVRDRAMAHFPYFSRWIAADQTLVDETERLRVLSPLSRLHELHQLALKPGGEATHTTNMESLARQIEADLDRAVTSYRKELDASHNADTQEEWHKLEALLRVPAFDPKLMKPDERLKLIEDARRISWTLHKEMNQEERGKNAAATAPLEASQSRRLALFATASAEGKTADEKIKLLTTNLVKRATDADDQTGQAEKEGTLDRAVAHLAAPASAARQLEGWVPGSFGVEKYLKDNPVKKYHQLLRHQLFCWLAGRAYLDHWAADRAAPGNRHYYQMVGDAFLADASQVLKDAGRPDSDALTMMRQRLARRTTLQVEWSPLKEAVAFTTDSTKVVLADEPDVERYYQVVGVEDVAKTSNDGKAVTWVELGSGLTRAKEDEGQRVREFGKSFTSKIKPAKAIGERGPHKLETRHQVQAYFRGHVATAVTPISIYGEPDVVIVEPGQERDARLSVQATDKMFEKYASDKAAVSIVLDCSGSMWHKDVLGSDDSRWTVMLAALKGVLAKLPRGVSVSLRAFSAKHMIEPYRNVPDKKKEFYTANELIWKTHPWEPDNFSRKWKDIEGLVPEGSTPLLRTMRKARSDYPPKFKGRRLMVVLTDGGDSNFYDKKDRLDDDDLKNGKSGMKIKEFLRKEFVDHKAYEDIELIVVGFNVKKFNSPEEQVAAEDMSRAIPQIGGRYYTPNDRSSLERDLSDALLNISYKVDADRHNPGADKAVQTGFVTKSNSLPVNPRWVSLFPKEFKTHTVSLRSNLGLEGRIKVDYGEQLVLDLVDDKHAGPAFRRSLYATSYAVEHGHAYKWRHPVKEGWHFSVLQNWQGGNGGPARLMATIEKDQGPIKEERLIQIVRPQWTWFELHGSTPKLADLQVAPLAGYPAPAWSMEVRDWPPGEPATLKAWWLEPELGQFAKQFTVPTGSNILSLRQVDWDSKVPKEERVVIESVALEQCKINLPQKGSEELRPSVEDECLVIRLRYPENAGSYFVQLGDESVWTAHAHRWYREGGKYSAIFWPVTLEMARSVRRIQLYNIEKLKQKSLSAELKLGEPNKAQVRPSASR